MSVVLRRTYDGGYLFEYACDGCRRPAILATELPPGWDPLRAADGALLHRCASCTFDLIVEPLLRDLGWGEAA